MPSNPISKRPRAKAKGSSVAVFSKALLRVKGKVSVQARGIDPASSGLPSDELQRLHRGELTASEYLQLRVAQATSHLRGHVSSRRLERIRQLVVEACATDPLLLAMQERLQKTRR